MTSVMAATGGDGSSRRLGRMYPLPAEYPVTLKVVDNEFDLMQMVDRLDASEKLAVDTEATGLRPVDDMPICVGLCGDADPGIVYVIPLGFRALENEEANLSTQTAVGALRRLFHRADRLVVGHNLKFDAHMLKNIGVTIKSKWQDTLYDCFLLKEKDLELLDLKAQTRKRLGIPAYEYHVMVEQPKKTVMRRLAFEPACLVMAYCAMDVYNTFALSEVTEKALKREVRRNTNKTMWTLSLLGSRFVRTLWRMERRGFSVDVDVLRKKTALAERDLLAVEKDVYRMAAEAGPEWGDPKKFNLGSGPQVGRLLKLLGVDKQLPCTDVWPCEHRWQEQVQMKTKVKTVIRRCKGKAVHMKESWDKVSTVLCPACGNPIAPKRATGKDSLEILEDQGVPFASALAKRKKIATLLQTFLRPMESRISPITGRVHSTFNVAGARTGRLSSNDPNLQNIPTTENDVYKIREVFIAAKGRTLTVADYSQLELRLLAHFSGERQLIDAFARGDDPHAVTGALMLGWSLKRILRLLKEAKEEQVAAKKEGRKPALTSLQSAAIRIRKIGKVLNFAIVYGAGPTKIARLAGITLTEAKMYLEKHQGLYPGIYAFKAACSKLSHETGYTYTLTGFRRSLKPLIYSSDKKLRSGAERQAMNTWVQGSAACLAMMAMIVLDEAREAGTFGLNLLLQVHDELIFEGKGDPSEEDLAMVKSVMEVPFAEPLSVPLLVEPTVGLSWAAAKAG